eukprot:1087524-Rhodomonas_salina.1
MKYRCQQPQHWPTGKGCIPGYPGEDTGTRVPGTRVHVYPCSVDIPKLAGSAISVDSIFVFQYKSLAGFSGPFVHRVPVYPGVQNCSNSQASPGMNSGDCFPTSSSTRNTSTAGGLTAKNSFSITILKRTGVKSKNTSWEWNYPRRRVSHCETWTRDTGTRN